MKKILNILLGVLMAITVVMMAYAIFTGGSEAAISANLVWGYVLMVLAICSVIFCAVYGMMKNPAGIKGTLLSLGLVVVVVLASYFVAAGRDILIPNFSDGGAHSDGDRRLQHSGSLYRHGSSHRGSPLFGSCEIIQIREE